MERRLWNTAIGCKVLFRSWGVLLGGAGSCGNFAMRTGDK